MAVEARYFSTRDPQRTMFADKKDADAHDRLLEATEEVAELVEQAHDSIDHETAYQIAMALVEKREDLMQALKKAPKASRTEESGAEAGDGSGDDADADASAAEPTAPAVDKPARKPGKRRAA